MFMHRISRARGRGPRAGSRGPGVPGLSSRRSCGRRTRPRSGTGRSWPSPRTWRTCPGTGRLRGARDCPWIWGNSGRAARETPQSNPTPKRDAGGLWTFGPAGFSLPKITGKGVIWMGMTRFSGCPLSPRSSSSWAHTVRTQISLLMTYTRRRLEFLGDRKDGDVKQRGSPNLQRDQGTVSPPSRTCRSRSRSGTACRACARSRAGCRGTAPPCSLGKREFPAIPQPAPPPGPVSPPRGTARPQGGDRGMESALTERPRLRGLRLGQRS